MPKVYGYARLSRDEDRRNYGSIENQKEMILDYAKQHGWEVDHIFEDDNVSGYKLNRPAFSLLLDELQAGDVLIAKDLSRIGRHNAKVLMLIEELNDQKVQLELISGSYSKDNPDILGIETWFNERIVTDTSRKVRQVFHAKQENGTLKVKAPFGYRTEPDGTVSIVEKEARVVRHIYHEYLKGKGYRRIADELQLNGTPTPSMLMSERGMPQSRIAAKWSSDRVRDILKNDYYGGTLRLRKRRREKINGVDQRVPKEEQLVFDNHHEPIVDTSTFCMVQKLMSRKIVNRYTESTKESIFGKCVYCADCGKPMGLIQRHTRSEKRYFVCSTYSRKGKLFCEHSHRINEQTVMETIMQYLSLCRESMKDSLAVKKMDKNSREKQFTERALEMEHSLVSSQNQLQTMLKQKIIDIAQNPKDADILRGTYELAQRDLLDAINRQQSEMNHIKKLIQAEKDGKNYEATALEYLDRVIEQQSLTGEDIAILVDKIVVEKDGSLEIDLNFNVSNMVDEAILTEKLQENRSNIMADMIHIIILDIQRGFTSKKRIYKALRERGHSFSNNKAAEYIKSLEQQGVLKETGNPRRPYHIVASEEEMREIEKQYAFVV